MILLHACHLLSFFSIKNDLEKSKSYFLLLFFLSSTWCSIPFTVFGNFLSYKEDGEFEIIKGNINPRPRNYILWKKLDFYHWETYPVDT